MSHLHLQLDCHREGPYSTNSAPGYKDSTAYVETFFPTLQWTGEEKKFDIHFAILGKRFRSDSVMELTAGAGGQLVAVMAISLQSGTTSGNS